MAISSSASFTLLQTNPQIPHRNGEGGEMICSLLSCRTSTTSPLQRSATRTSSSSYKGFRKKDFVIVRNATPEAAGDLLSSFSIPGFSLPGDNPWITGIAGLLVTVPFLVQWLLTLTKEVDLAAETVEKIADTVGKVAEEVDKAAEEIAEALPEGGLKKMVSFVEDLAEETTKDAQMVEDLMDKVEELDDKLDTILKQQSKGTDKA
ncbi:hypothetical protein Sango_1158300 [Sesamum angolense]|uniref:Plastid-targeted protein 2 n=1 Tax=Sesamum angolense TaxID=2727404 RepID=A0AAE1WVT8_9LAMI|nr:hypothetical protein Sango_1158300 [Sesamum angolense]